jgi:hypothetical protein
VTIATWWLFVVGALLILDGIRLALDALQGQFEVATSGGQSYSLRLAITGKARAQALAEQVNSAIVRLHEGVGS